MTRKQILHILRQRRVPLLVSALLIIVNLVAYIGLSLYVRPALDKLQNEWFSRRRSLAGEHEPGRADRYAQGRKELEEWQSRIPSRREFAPLLSRLFTFAGSRNVQITGITYKPAVEKDRPFLTYVIGLSVKGTYAGVKSFLGDVMALREMVIVDAASFSNSSATQEQVELKLQLTSYFRVDQ